MMSHFNMRWIIVFSFLMLSACDEAQLKKETASAPGEEKKEQLPPPIAEPIPVPNPTNPIDRICSSLDFRNVDWPVTMSLDEQMYFALALNVTGSFEGNVGWKNLAGNFDGQGISMGLMQQNLGQGTLQPLWIEALQRDRNSVSKELSSGQVLSMQRMLEAWRGGPLPITFAQSQTKFQGTLFPQGNAFNDLDENYKDTDFDEANLKNQASVNWAKSEALDARGQVNSGWKKPLENIAVTPIYRSLQVRASLTYFLKAQAYLTSFGFTEIRFLLLMYDFVVQNGSIGQSHLVIYNNWLKQNPNANQEQKALALLEARLTTVKDQYKSDVRARKTTIIKGEGVVHQKRRNLPIEYCFNSQEAATQPLN
jgi:hypothetical protein